MAAQLPEPGIDSGHPGQHTQKLRKALLHKTRRLLVKCKGGCGADEGNIQFFRIQLSPDTDGIRYYTIRLPGPQLTQYLIFHGKRYIHSHIHQGGQILSYFFVNIFWSGRHKIIAGYADGACFFNTGPELIKGIVMDLISPFYQLTDDLYGRIGMPIGRNTEKYNFTHVTVFLSFTYALLY